MIELENECFYWLIRLDEKEIAENLEDITIDDLITIGQYSSEEDEFNIIGWDCPFDSNRFEVISKKLEKPKHKYTLTKYK